MVDPGGTWLAHSVECVTLGLRVVSSSPTSGHCADSSEAGACFGFCVSFSLCPSPAHALSPSVSKISSNILKSFKNK